MVPRRVVLAKIYTLPITLSDNHKFTKRMGVSGVAKRNPLTAPQGDSIKQRSSALCRRSGRGQDLGSYQDTPRSSGHLLPQQTLNLLNFATGAREFRPRTSGVMRHPAGYASSRGGTAGNCQTTFSETRWPRNWSLRRTGRNTWPSGTPTRAAPS